MHLCWGMSLGPGNSYPETPQPASLEATHEQGPSRGYHALITCLSCTELVADHTLITCLPMHESRKILM